ncbi:MAG: hypothetical protein ACO3XO_07425 [Bdellovibrionota bacterium]
MEIKKTIKKIPFQQRWKGTWRLSGSISEVSCSLLVHHVLKKLLPKEVLTGKTLINLKGRDERHVLLDTFAQEHIPTGQEILFVLGSADLSAEPITYRINSPFLQFGNNHIEHSPVSERSFHTPRFLRVESIGDIIPFSIQHFRCGLERYESLFKALSLGYVPEVVDRLIIDYSKGRLEVELEALYLPTQETLPFPDFPAMNSLLNLLEQL